MKKLLIVLLVFITLGAIISSYSTFTHYEKVKKENKTMAGTLNLNDALASGGLYVGSTSDPAVTGAYPYTTAPLNVDSGGSVYGGGTTYSTPSTYTAPASAPDPYAAWGGGSAGQAKMQALQSGFNTQHQNLLDTANSTADSYGQNKYSTSILDLLGQLGQGQKSIDNQTTQNELSKRTGTQNVLDMVGRGIRSGGVTLNNKNAGSSSAAQGIADAYAQLGRGQLSSVGNQYAQGQNSIQNAQSAFDTQQQAGVRDLQASKNDYVTQLINTTRDQLGQLQTQMAYASLPDRIAIDQEIATIKQNALNNLQQYDTQLSQGVGNIHPIGQDAAREQATQLAQAGQAPANAFQFNTQAPAQFQGTGPFASDLPLFSTPRGTKQFA